jgi:signal transduction histidine kinase
VLQRPFLTVVLAVAGGCWSVAAIAALTQHSGVTTTYAAASAAAAAVFLIAGLGLYAVGALAARDWGSGSLAWLCVLASAAWLSPALVGWEGGPPLVLSLGVVVAPFLVPVLAHLVQAAPTGRVYGRLRRTAVAATYGLTTLASVGYVVSWDPFRDRYCWSDCTDNAFLLAGDPARARVIETAWLGTVVTVGILTLLAATWRLVTATGIARTAGWPVIAPAALASTLEAGAAAARLADRTEGPDRDVLLELFLARGTALTALAAGVAWFLWHRRGRNAAFVRLINELDAPAGTGSLQAALSRMLGDSSLTVAYRLPGVDRYVDRSGLPAHPRTEPGRASTSIVRLGAQLAVVSHERDILDDRAVRQRFGSAALLAIDNERLSAELLAHLADLRDSQRRIVAAADEARRRIERDLHDGAQQRLLAAFYELRLARSDPIRSSDEAAALDALIDAAQRSLAELRELAHGIFPAILDEAGLETALWSLADQSTTVVQIGAVPVRRLPAATEQTAYLVVTETLATVPADAGALTVAATLQADTLVLRIDGPQPAPSQYLHDRVGAVEGTINYTAGALHVELPCG